jgi:hypothetical protein
MAEPSTRAKWRALRSARVSTPKKYLTGTTLSERRFYLNKLPRYAGCESLDDIAKDHVTHTDRRADGSGQNKVDTDDRQHGCSLGNEIPLHVWNTHECNNCTVTFGTSLVQLPLGQAPKRGNDPVNCVSVLSAVTVSGGREGGIGTMHCERTPRFRGLKVRVALAARPESGWLTAASKSAALNDDIFTLGER